MGIAFFLSLTLCRVDMLIIYSVQRALFWTQAPLAALAGLGIFLALPPHVGVDERERSKAGSFWAKARKIDYLGATILVSFLLFIPCSSEIYSGTLS